MTIIGANEHSRACPHCGTTAILPEWSEVVAENEIAYIWRCIGCGKEFDTKCKVLIHEPNSVELVKEFLPNLVVA